MKIDVRRLRVGAGNCGERPLAFCGRTHH
jgi:hypothetical protein